MGILDRVREFVGNQSAVKRVADDEILIAEIILLIRLLFADGVLKPAETRYFQQLCVAAFNIPEDEFAEVMQFVRNFGYETSAEQAAAVFEEMPLLHKRRILVRMLSVAKADNELHQTELDMIRRTASLLGVSAEELLAAREAGEAP
ncbi:MAG: TerB family tellurite resistance protein [Pseudomonadota bacterium]